jgi:hypothetical protein
MVPTEAAVERLRTHLAQILDEADADTLVSVFDTSELATKHDAALLRADMDLLRAEMQALKHELVAAFRGELNTAITNQTKPLLITIFCTAVVFAGSLLAAVLFA